MDEMLRLFPDFESDQKTIEGVKQNVEKLCSSTDVLTAMIQSLSGTLEDVLKENSKMRAEINEIHARISTGSAGSSQEEQAIMNSLIIENRELKLQRVEMSRQISKIHKEYTDLKEGDKKYEQVVLEDPSDQMIVSDECF
jgi:predicted  nucleic acid-binding Zn-ribbon protein